MDTALTPTNITGAALIAQFSILLILAAGSAILSFDNANTTRITPFILVLALISFGVLFFSDEFSKLWSPLFRGTSFSGIKWSLSILLVFIANILVVSILVRFTWGSIVSPFTPVYFMLPALAIFLRESGGRIIIYLTLVILLFTLNFQNIYLNENGRSSRHIQAYWVISVACFVLITYVGYITRPSP
ncbi:MAG: hypothetical protein V1766_09520 [Pseudomonadota bacterium]